jgi:hypothetical protein
MVAVNSAFAARRKPSAGPLQTGAGGLAGAQKCLHERESHDDGNPPDKPSPVSPLIGMS